MKHIKKFNEEISEFPRDHDLEEENEPDKSSCKNKDMFIKALETLFGSWGSDTPPEACWAAREFLEFYEEEFNVDLGINHDAEYNSEEVIAAIENS